jgi:4-hydroxybenzoyl-CoA thioesterase
MSAPHGHPQERTLPLTSALVHRMPIRIEWGKCDPAAITFYPNYFAWFDAGTWQMFEAAGCAPQRLLEERGIYLPLVDAHARFHRPGHLGDDLIMESQVVEWRDRFFLVRHRALRGEELILEGEELRAWAERHPEDERRFKAVAIPDEIRNAFTLI